MALESATFIDGLVVTNPVGATDQISQGDNHLRLIKDTLKNSFPLVTKATHLMLAETNVASAATTDIGAVASDHVNVTGTTTITGLGTVGAGTHRTVRFAAALVLTHNGTSLILPTGANITTAADDVMEAYSLGSGNWIVTHYSKASGLALATAAEAGPRQATAATTANIVVATGLNSGDTIDGVTLADGDLVLVKNQVAPAENGVFVVSSSPVRDTRYDTYDEHPGASLLILEGTVNAGLKWICTSVLGGVLDTTALRFLRDSGADFGDVKETGRATAPAGWLLSFGQDVSETTYAELFAAIAYTFGNPGGGNFTLPDHRGRAVAGKDDMGAVSANRLTGLTLGVDGDILGDTGGEEAHTQTEAELVSHTHEQFRTSGDAGFEGSGLRGVSSQTSGGGEGGPTGGGGAMNTVQPTIIMNKIIYVGV